MSPEVPAESKLHVLLAFLAGLGLAAASGCGRGEAVRVCGQGAATTRSRPSFVIVVADTLRADYLQRRDSGGAISPSLDAFALEAVDFRSAFSQAPWTKPSVASLLTGLVPQLHGVMNHDGLFFAGADGGPNRVGILPADVDTLAETLGGAGYQSAGFVANEWLAPGYGYEQGFDRYEKLPRDRPGAVFAQAERWIAQRDPKRPFVVYLHGMEVHGPYEAPASRVEPIRASGGLGPSQPLGGDDFAAIPAYLRSPEWTQQARARDVREWRIHYAAGVRAFDAGFRTFLERGRAQGWLDESVVVVTSDHGEELFDHGGWDHGATLFDEQLHVPLLFRLPQGRGGGRRVESIVSLVDVNPTLIEMAGLPAPSGRSGRSLLHAICGREDEAVTDWTIASATKHNPSLYALRNARFKFILDTRSGAGALFDLRADPGEQRDVARARLEDAKPLALRLWRQVVALQQRGAPTPQTVTVDAETKGRLEALGYADSH